MGGFSYYNERASVKAVQEGLETLAEEVASHLEIHIMEASRVGITLSSAPLVAELLQHSNQAYDELSETDREARIDQLNQRWMQTESISDAFIAGHLNNPVAAFLKQQQELFAGTYGEIFLTNRFGVMLASTGRLTTLAHAHKYWWRAAFNHGSGKVFIDDRGFDTSVSGYVLGVVVPIRKDGELIGLLKSNINILGPISDIIDGVDLKHDVVAKLVRSNGLVVYEKGKLPLSTETGKSLADCVSSHVTLSTVDDSYLVACAPVQVTIESKTLGFGGIGQSIDQLKGNVDETWTIVLSEDRNIALTAARETARALILIGLVIVVFATILAWLLGHLAAKPIVALSDVAKAIGDGSLETRADEGKKDEIGSLAASVNSMAENLQSTMASRDELAREIELREAAEKQLRFLSSSVEQAGEAISITNLDGVIEYVNPAFTRVTGYESHEVIGKNLNILNSDQQDSSFFREMWNRIKSGQRWQGRIVEKAKDGSLYPAMMTISPILNDSNEITHFVSIQQELAEYEEMESKLHQAQKMEALGVLVGGIAHDFNNKFAAITGKLYLAKTKAVQLPEVMKHLNDVEILSFKAAETIKQLLIFVRKDIVNMRSLDLAQQVRKLIKAEQSGIQEGVGLFQNICAEELLVRGDETQLHQVFSNLLSNAVDAVAEVKEPEIMVKVEAITADDAFRGEHQGMEAERYACVLIRDNGCGISDEVMAHLFEPFYSTKGVEPGKGMGLAMVYGAVQQHGGVISIKNNAGPGVSVHVYLPLIET